MAKKGEPRRLTLKAQRFAAEYLKDGSPSEAYLRAGYKGTTTVIASVGAQRLMADPRIALLIEQGRQRISAKLEMNAQQVLSELALIAASDIGDIMDFSNGVLRLKRPSDIPELARRAIQSVKVKRYMEGRGEDAREVEVTEFRLWSKVDALGKLAQVHGLLTHDKDESAKRIEEFTQLVGIVARLRIVLEERGFLGPRPILDVGSGTGESNPAAGSIR